MWLHVIIESMQVPEPGNLCLTSVSVHALCYCILNLCLKMNVSGMMLILFCINGLSFTVRRHFNSEETARVVQMIEDGLSQCRLARYLGVSPSVVNRLWNHYLETGNYNRRPGQGRPRATTGVQERYLRTLALRNRQSRALRNDFQLATGVRLSNQTVRNRLHNDTLQARRPATGPVLTVAHQLNFAQNQVGWQLAQWRMVLFTDESRFHVSTCDTRVRVWRHPGERYMDCNIVQHDRFGVAQSCSGEGSVLMEVHSCIGSLEGV